MSNSLSSLSDLDPAGEEDGSDSLDLSKRELIELPCGLINKHQHVKMCYLQDNSISMLPEDFFKVLQNLEYLDLRNNNLESLPCVGLAGHSKLSVLLLQSNMLKTLPLELGRVPNIQGLQIAGNPIENVPFETIARGLNAVLQHLRSLDVAETSLQPVSETCITKNDKIGCNQKGTQPEIRNIVMGERKRVSARDVRRPSFSAVASGGFKCKKWLKRHQADESRSSSTGGSWHRRPPKLISFEQVLEREAQDEEKAKLKETLGIQAKLIQRIKDAETVRNWRKATMEIQSRKLLDNFQYSPSNNFLDKSPFDVDQDMFRMLKRADLYLSLREWEDKYRNSVTPRKKLTLKDMEVQMKSVESRLSDIMKREKEEIETSDKLHLKTRLVSRIEEISKLRQSLMMLHTENMKQRM